MSDKKDTHGGHDDHGKKDEHGKGKVDHKDPQPVKVIHLELTSSPDGKDVKVKVVEPKDAHGHEAKTTEKTRFKLEVEGERLESPKFVGVIPMQTFDEHFKPASGKVVVVGSKLLLKQTANFYDATTGAVLAQNAKGCEFTTGADGKFNLRVEFKGQFHILLELTSNGVKRVITLVYKQSV